MKARGFVVIICTLLLMVVPFFVVAESYDIGNEVQEQFLASGDYLYNYDTGAYIITGPDYGDYVLSLFDGNLSTSLDHQFGPSHTTLRVDLYFGESLNVTDISIIPGTLEPLTQFTFGIILPHGPLLTLYGSQSSDTKQFFFNGSLAGVFFTMNNAGTDYMKFNEILINYTPTPSDIPEILDRLDTLEGNITSLEYQIDTIYDLLNQFNATLGLLDFNQQMIISNINDLWGAFYTLNKTVSSFIENHTDYNGTWILENITWIDMALEEIGLEIIFMKKNETNLTSIWTSINQTTQDIESLNQNLTKIQSSLPSEYNDTQLLNRIDELESDKKALIGRLTHLEFENDILSDEFNKLKDTQEDETFWLVDTMPLILSILALICVIAMLGYWASKSPPRSGKITDDDDEDEDEDEKEDEEDDEEDEEEEEEEDEDDEPVRSGKAKKVDELEITMKKLKK